MSRNKKKILQGEKNPGNLYNSWFRPTIEWIRPIHRQFLRLSCKQIFWDLFIGCRSTINSKPHSRSYAFNFFLEENQRLTVQKWKANTEHLMIGVRLAIQIRKKRGEIVNLTARSAIKIVIKTKGWTFELKTSR